MAFKKNLFTFLFSAAVMGFYFLYLPFALAQGINFDLARETGTVHVKLEENGVVFERLGQKFGTSFISFSRLSAEVQAQAILERYQKKSKYMERIQKDMKRGWTFQSKALAALGALRAGAVSYVPEILPFLNDKNRAVRFNAFWALSQIAPNDPDIGLALINFYRNNNDNFPDVALKIIYPLKDLQGSVANEILISAIKNNGFTFPYAKEILNIHGGSQEAIFIEYLQHFDESYRKNAVVLVAAIDKQDKVPLIPFLVALLKDVNSDVRMLAAYSLGQVGGPIEEAIPVLKEMGNSSNKQERNAALLTLKKMGYYDIAAEQPNATRQKISEDEIYENLKSPIKDKVLLGLLAIKDMDEEGKIIYLPGLISTLDTQYPSVTRWVMAILVSLKEKGAPAIPKLIELYRKAAANDQINQRKDILLTLAHLAAGQANLVPLLVEIFEENDYRFIPGAISLTTVIGEEARPLLPYLQDFLEDVLQVWGEDKSRSRSGEETVQIAFIAIGEIGDPGPKIMKLLEAFAETDNPGFRGQAAFILAKLKAEN